MLRQAILTNDIQTLSLLSDRIVDWANSGRQFFLNGQREDLGTRSYSFPFDSAVTCQNGIYAVIYQKLGTKGVLLKNGAFIREINRSYYQAELYEYPVAFATLQNGKTYLIHCPFEYCQIDVEDVETGEVVTNVPNRAPTDFFHARFEVSPDNKTLLSKGWAWHPCDFVAVFDIEAGIRNPVLLDKSQMEPDVHTEICSATFVHNNLVLIGASNDAQLFDETPSEKLKNGQIALWDILTNTVSEPVTPNFRIGGHFVAIDDNYAWDLYDFPKIFNFRTGVVTDKMEDINSGQQVSSIIAGLDLPQIAINPSTKQIAIKTKNDAFVEVLTPTIQRNPAFLRQNTGATT